MTRGGNNNGRGTRNQAAIFETTMDALNISHYTALSSGRYSFQGSAALFMQQSLNIPPPKPPNMHGMGMMIPGVMPFSQQMYPMMQQQNYMNQQETMMIPDGGRESLVNKGSITLVGNKTKPSNICCFSVTMIFADFFIFPLFFTCCMWWKKIVYPTYEVSIDAYEALANLIQRLPNLKDLSLTVVDNVFNAEKAQIIHDAFSGIRITRFNFTNRALACNGQFSEADDFIRNMTPIKSSYMNGQIVWGDISV